MKYLISIILVSCLLFLLYLILKPYHNRRVVWGMFYNTLWVSVVAGVVNYICVTHGFWSYTHDNAIHFPSDLYFIWVVLWGVVPFYFLRGKYLFILVPFVLLIDISLMPVLEQLGLLYLSENWLIGELLIVCTVFFPGYYWAKISFINIQHWMRTIFQIVIMTLFLFVILPYSFYVYGVIDHFSVITNSIWLQVIFIVSLPALIATNDLVILGKGTPFPYDKTKHLVRNGVYAYCRNPIQWSFTLMFIPFSIYYESWYLISGTLISIAYTIGVSEVQEYPDMENRFGQQWKDHIKVVPKWYFQWKPNGIEKAEYYFDDHCGLCREVKAWFSNKDTTNLMFKPASEYSGEELTQVTYITELGESFQSVEAIGYALGHINLMWAFIGWIIRLPIIKNVLQMIINANGLGEKGDSTC